LRVVTIRNVVFFEFVYSFVRLYANVTKYRYCSTCVYALRVCGRGNYYFDR